MNQKQYEDEAGELSLARGDHWQEIASFNAALERLCERFWFVGRSEIIGSLERQKFNLLMRFYNHDSDEADDGDEWKKVQN